MSGLEIALIAGGLGALSAGVSAGANMYTAAQANKAAAGRAFEANATGVEMMRQGFSFDSEQAAIGREWDEKMWDRAALWNKGQAIDAWERNNLSADRQWERSLDMLARDQAFAREQQGSQQQFNADQARLQREWQERLSGTAYQRGMADMRAAGLNPILAGTNQGASTPTGALASSAIAGASGNLPGLPGGPGASLGSPHGATARAVGFHPGAQAQVFQPDLSSAVNSAYKGAMMFTDLQQAQANIARTNAETLSELKRPDLIESQRHGTDIRAEKEWREKFLVEAQTKTEQENPALRQAQAQAAVAAAAASHQSVQTGKAAARYDDSMTDLNLKSGRPGTMGAQAESLSRVFDQIRDNVVRHFSK